MIDYRTKKELSGVIVCLYNPSNPETPCTMELLVDYINGCYWQLVNGQRPRRTPFFISNVPSECHRMTAEFIRNLQGNRKEQKTTDSGDNCPLRFGSMTVVK